MLGVDKGSVVAVVGDGGASASIAASGGGANGMQRTAGLTVGSGACTGDVPGGGYGVCAVVQRFKRGMWLQRFFTSVSVGKR